MKTHDMWTNMKILQLKYTKMHPINTYKSIQ